MDEQAQSQTTRGNRERIATSLAAIASVIAASSCCLPILPFVFAAGAAGGSAIFVRLRPLFLVAAIGFVGFGFYQGWRAKRCNRRTSLLSDIMLWCSTAIVIVAVFFPQLLANAIAGLLAR
ncbi:MAG: hypothetical protein ACRD3T_21380 [Terriglobia bacterium]